MPNTKMFVDTIDRFQPGDFVTPLDHGVTTTNTFYGVVTAVDRKINKVFVEWNGGRVAQHDPNDINHYPVLMKPEDIQRRFRSCYASCKVASKVEKIANGIVNDMFVGDPAKHGIDTPLSGGTDVMQNLVKELRQESMGEAGKVHLGTVTAGSRRAVYYRSKGRIYQRSKSELDYDVTMCPKCDSAMDEESFTRGVVLHRCPQCGWKITSDKLI